MPGEIKTPPDEPAHRALYPQGAANTRDDDLGAPLRPYGVFAMSRVKRGFKARRRRNRILKLAKGYRGSHSKLYRSAVEAVERGLVYAYRDRKQRKRAMRRLWIVRINAAARQQGMSYSRLIGGLTKANVELDRKVLAELAIADPAAFAEVVNTARAALN